MNFGGIDETCTSLATAPFVVIPVPYDLTSTYQSGSRRGPAAILEASSHMELFDEELGRETYLAGIHTAPPIEPDARGPHAMIDAVRRRVGDVLSLGKIPVLLGGEHSISLGAVQAMRNRYADIAVLQLDAHADMRDSYQGSPYSHASVARRIHELCPLVQAGVRSMSAEEAEYLREKKVDSFPAHAISPHHAWHEEVCANIRGDVYVTIDLDVLDPSIMPSTGTPEPGGITWRDILLLMRRVSKESRVRGFDIVELSPIPGMVAPDFLAAKLAYRIMGYVAESV